MTTRPEKNLLRATRRALSRSNMTMTLPQLAAWTGLSEAHVRRRVAAWCAEGVLVGVLIGTDNAGRPLVAYRLANDHDQAGAAA